MNKCNRKKINLRNILQSFVWRFHILKKDINLKRLLSDLERNQYLSTDELEYLSLQKKKKILTYAYQNVPYYRFKYNKEKFHPNDLKEPSDFLKVPLLYRDEIKNNLENIVATGIERTRLRPLGTGGSTGQPLKVYHDKNNDLLSQALMIRMLSWWGIYPWTDSATVFRVVKAENHKKDEVKANSNATSQARQNIDVLGKIKGIIYENIHPKIVNLDAACMDNDSINNFLHTAKEIQPTYILGYVGGVDEVASYINKYNLVGQINPKAVWVNSAPLSDVQRHHIGKAFGCPVYDQYGSVEVYWLAAECKACNGLHCFSDVRTIEFLDLNDKPTEPNVSGRVVLTDLENYAMPIIRYENGDLGSRSDKVCSCGVKLPLINSIKGRETDKIFLHDGSVIAGEYLTTIFDDYADEVRNFQVRQISADQLLIKVVMEKVDSYHHIIKKVGDELANNAKGHMKISFQKVREIKHDRGKYRYVINDVIKKS